jgi:hypothetical protein
MRLMEKVDAQIEAHWGWLLKRMEVIPSRD